MIVFPTTTTAVSTVSTTTQLFSSRVSSTSIAPTPLDVAFHDWCDAASILVNPKVSVATTPLSVAGRGVFSLEPLTEGEVIAVIPVDRILSAETAAPYFPDTARKIRRRKQRRALSNRVSSFFFRTNNENDDLWPAELTRYASDALEENHPWSLWIEQWQRDDPMHVLFQSCSFNDNNEEIRKGIQTTAQTLQQQMPCLNQLKLEAAVAIRMNRLHTHQRYMGITKDMSKLYSLVTSRAISLDNGCSGIIPFYDMINHAPMEPNVQMSYDGECFSIYASREIQAEEELYLLYTPEGEEMDENGALWALVQWGIPTKEADVIWDEEKTHGGSS